MEFCPPEPDGTKDAGSRRFSSGGSAALEKLANRAEKQPSVSIAAPQKPPKESVATLGSSLTAQGIRRVFHPREERPLLERMVNSYELHRL